MTFSSQRKEPSTQSLDLKGRKLPQVSVDRVHLPSKHLILLTASWLPLTVHTPGTQGRSSLGQIPWKSHLEWLQTGRPQGQRTRLHPLSLSMEPEREQQLLFQEPHPLVSHNGRLGWGSVMTSELCDAHSPCGQTFPVSISERERLLRGR